MFDEHNIQPHIDVIKSLTVEGQVIDPIKIEFQQLERDGKEIKEAKGVCVICRQPFISGFALKCPECNKILHPACEHNHMLTSHLPRGVTVILIPDENKVNTYRYIEKDRKLIEVPIHQIPTSENREDVIDDAIDETPTLADDPLPSQPIEPAVDADWGNEEPTREGRAERAKRRGQGKSNIDPDRPKSTKKKTPAKKKAAPKKKTTKKADTSV